ncbi:MAG: OmpH family outer membrane protein [Acidobacteria bacterium]|nr:OmpH family outer membrane protein [Acidobacteriota bacterium]
MKQIRLIAAAVALAALNVAAASAQAPAARPAAQPAAGTSSTPARVAIIDSRYFRGTDEKGTGGIARYITAAKQLEAQFQPQVTELQRMQTNLAALVEDIKKTSAVAAPAEIARKQDQAQELELQIKRKSEDAQRLVESRQEEVMRPIEADVFNAITAFAQQRGYSIVIDVARVPVLYAADSLDITKEFIAEYNRTRPATASTAAPAGTRP